MSTTRALIAREGADALTMRRLADEAGCAVGLTYKLFADRREPVREIVRADVCLLTRPGAGIQGGDR